MCEYAQNGGRRQLGLSPSGYYQPPSQQQQQQQRRPLIQQPLPAPSPQALPQDRGQHPLPLPVCNPSATAAGCEAEAAHVHTGCSPARSLAEQCLTEGTSADAACAGKKCSLAHSPIDGAAAGGLAPAVEANAAEVKPAAWSQRRPGVPTAPDAAADIEDLGRSPRKRLDFCSFRAPPDGSALRLAAEQLEIESQDVLVAAAAGCAEHAASVVAASAGATAAGACDAVPVSTETEVDPSPQTFFPEKPTPTEFCCLSHCWMEVCYVHAVATLRACFNSLSFTAIAKHSSSSSSLDVRVLGGRYPKEVDD